MSKKILTVRSKIADLSKQVNRPKAYKSYLAEPYDSIGQFAMITNSRASSSSAVRARVAAGDFNSGSRIFPTGTPVVVFSKHGKLEIFSLGKTLGGFPIAVYHAELPCTAKLVPTLTPPSGQAVILFLAVSAWPDYDPANDFAPYTLRGHDFSGGAPSWRYGASADRIIASSSGSYGGETISTFTWPEWKTSLVAYVSANGTPSLAQFDSVVSVTGSATVTLAAPPTPGNLLVMMLAVRSAPSFWYADPPSVPWPAGWISDSVNGYGCAGVGYMEVRHKIAQLGDTGSFTWSGLPDAANLIVHEYSGW